MSVLDSGARGAATTFVERGIGDVLLAWENEARLTIETRPSGQFEIVVPSVTLLAEPTVSVVDTFARQHGTEATARSYLEYLYSVEKQTIIGKHHFRGRRPPPGAAPAPAGGAEPSLVSVADLGGWDAVQRKHFAEGGLYDHMNQRP